MTYNEIWKTPTEAIGHVTPDQLIGPVAIDTETTGLHPDDGHTVAVVSIAFRVDTDDILSYAFPFDVGRSEDKGFETRRYSEKAKKALRGLPKGDPTNMYGEWDADYNLPLSEYQVLMRWLKKAGQRVGLVGHNAGFDTHMLAAGVRPRVVVWPDLDQYVRMDTMLAAGVIWPTQPKGLKAISDRLEQEGLLPAGQVLAAEVLAGALAEAKKRYGLTKLTGPRYDLVPWETLGPYAADDTRLTLQLFEIEVLEAIDPVVQSAMLRETKLGRVLHAIERRGLGPYDTERACAEYELINARLGQLEATAPFLPITPPKARDWFYGQLGARPGQAKPDIVWKPAPGESVHDPDGIKTGSKSLGTLSVVTARRMAKAGIAWADEYAEYLNLSSNARYYHDWPNLIGPDRRLRATFRQGYVRSGRMSVERVQLQAMPRKLGLTVNGQTLTEPKRLFLVPPGRKRVVLDLAQAELRIAVMYSGCDKMADLIRHGQDLHGSTTTEIFGVTPDHPEWGRYRSIGKQAVFSCTFGTGPKTFQALIYKTTGEIMEYSAAAEIVHAFRAVYPEFEAQYIYWDQYVKQHGFIPLLGSLDGKQFSEVSRFGPRDYPNTGFSRRVQGSLARWSHDWLLAVERMTGQYEALVGTVHDSVILDLPEDKVEPIVEDITDWVLTNWIEHFQIPGGLDRTDWG